MLVFAGVSVLPEFRLALVGFLLVASSALVSCGGGEIAVPESSLDLGLTLLGKLLEEVPTGTHLISPMGTGTALSVAWVGAEGKTRGEIERVIPRPTPPGAEGDGGYFRFVNALGDWGPYAHPGSGVTRKMGSSLWNNAGSELVTRSSFQEEMDGHTEWGNGLRVDVGIERLGPGNPHYVDNITGWTSRRTNGLIGDVALPLTPEVASAYSLTVTYFSGIWDERFDPQGTVSHSFRTAMGAEVPIRMMRSIRTAPYAEWRGHEAIELLYADKEWSMVVILPREGAEPGDLVRDLRGGRWGSLMSSMEDRELDVGLPRFSVEWEGDLRGGLERMGVRRAFVSGRADFNSMVDGGDGDPLYFSTLFQKNVLKVHEEGASPAIRHAASPGAQSVASLTPAFIADRPFIVGIQHVPTGALLMLGAVAGPPWEGGGTRLGVSKEAARNAMADNLRRLAIQQDIYFDTQGYQYFHTDGDTVSGHIPAPFSMDLAPGVFLHVVLNEQDVGYTATATHGSLPGETCVLKVGLSAGGRVIC